MSRIPPGELWKQLVVEHEHMASTGSGTALRTELLTPVEIVEEMDRTVIGQETAKQLVAIAAWNRLLAMNNEEIGRDEDEFFFEKNNILLIGGTGCGKTHLIKALAKAVSLPVTIADATSITTAGYVGGDAEDCLESLMQESEKLVRTLYDTSKMGRMEQNELARAYFKYGIVYVDEADKIRAGSSSNRDVGGRNAQEAFLKLVEGSEVQIGDRAGLGQPDTRETVDTSNILFIFGGAFPDLKEIVAKRVSKKSIGFSAGVKEGINEDEMSTNVSIKDLTEFGMIPELLGRLSTIATLKTLDREMIKDIFVKPDRSILSQVINEFKSYGVHVSFTEDAIEYIVDETMSIQLGARGLKSVCQRILRPLFYYLPSNALSGDIIVSKKVLLEIEREGLV